MSGSISRELAESFRIDDDYEKNVGPIPESEDNQADEFVGFYNNFWNNLENQDDGNANV